MRLLCKTCGQSKPEKDFYVSNKSHCKKCIAQRARAYYQENKEAIKAYNRVRALLPHRVEYRKKYNQSERGKITARRARKAWRKRNQKKVNAMNAAYKAFKSGKLVRERCKICGSENTEMHHPDYDKPLKVTWLCSKHHHQAHK